MADIILGSGYVLIAELVNGEIPADGVFEAVDANGYYVNQFGFTKGGATLTSETEFTEISDDNGQVKENYLSSDSIQLKLGAFMKSGVDMLDDLKKLCPTAGEPTVDGGVTTLLLGGVANDNNKKYAVRFIHKDKKLRITIVGKNTDGFEFSFDPEDATVVEPTFSASALNAQGNLVKIDFEGTRTWQAVDDTDPDYATSNPHEMGWSTRHGSEGSYIYWLTDDEEPAQDETYYVLV